MIKNSYPATDYRGSAMIFLFLLACNPDKESDSSVATDSSEEQESVSARLAFEIAERPYDLALSGDGRIFCSAQGGSRIYHWSPETDLVVELNVDFDEAGAIDFSGEDLYFTTSDNGVTGSLSKLVGSEVTEIATQSTDGTLFRWPMDLLQAPDGSWLIADYNASAIFAVTEGGNTTVYSAGSLTPESLAWNDGILYIGGEDGIWKKQWPDGFPEQVDSRAAYGLVNIDGTIYGVNSTEGLFSIGGAEEAENVKVCTYGKMRTKAIQILPHEPAAGGIVPSRGWSCRPAQRWDGNRDHTRAHDVSTRPRVGLGDEEVERGAGGLIADEHGRKVAVP